MVKKFKVYIYVMSKRIMLYSSSVLHWIVILHEQTAVQYQDGRSLPLDNKVQLD